LKRIVYGSTICFETIAFVYAENGPGLFGTFGTRSIENATSSAVSSEPSVNLTPLRSLNSHVVGSITFHDVASPGIIFESASIWTSLSKMCSAALLFGKRLKKCGSIDVMSAATAILSSCAAAMAGIRDTESAATTAQAEKAWRKAGKRIGASAIVRKMRGAVDPGRSLSLGRAARY
jgi:hypothetical protein